MNLTNYITDFKLLSEQLREHWKTMSILDYFMLDDTSFMQKYFFINDVYESSSKNV